MSPHPSSDDSELDSRNPEPVTPRTEPVTPHPELAARNSQLATNRPVVVAEDDEGLNRLICRRLERHGLATVGAQSGADAIAAVQQHPDCLLLLDYVLPDMDGRQFLDKLNALGVVVPFVVMTGQADECIAAEMMKLGARDYIVKQVDFTDLLIPVVDRVLAQLATEQRLTQAEQALRESKGSK